MPKPSAGCKECKRRKIKCDERQGTLGCSNCVRRGISCSGAISQADSIIRDETSKVANKFVVVTDAPGPSAATGSMQEGSQLTTAVPPQTIPQAPSTADGFDELVLEMFYSTYCLRDFPRKSVEEFQLIGNGSLFAAVKTLGLESLEGRDEFQVMQLYNGAIGLLNVALGSADTANADSTLLATIMMCAIELKASPQRDLDDYFNHVKGASALLQLRGKEQVLTQLGAALYMQMSAQLYLSCLFGRQALPDGFRALREQIEAYIKNEKLPCWREHGAMMRYIDTKGKAEAMLQEDPLASEAANETVKDLLDIYEELSSVFDNAPAIWRFRAVPSDNSQPQVEEEHVFECFVAAQSWTSFRVTTVVLFDIVLRLTQRCEDQEAFLASLTADQWLYVNTASQIVKEAALAIIAGAPQQVGYFSLRLARPGNRSKKRLRLAPESFERTQIFHCDPFVRGQVQENADLPYVLFPAGISIYQALYLAATVGAVDVDVKEKLKGALSSIAADTGIRQAVQLSRMLEGTAT